MKLIIISLFATIIFGCGKSAYSDPVVDTTASDFNYVINDFTFYPIPQFPGPEKGVPYIDPYFNTTITRITDAITDGASPSWPLASSGYPKHNIENADGTMLIIQGAGGTGWHVWNANTPYNKIKSLPSSILNYGMDPDVRWDNGDPNILYSHHMASLYQWSVQTEVATELHDFTNDFDPPLAYIAMREEGDASDDRRYWAFIGISKDSDNKSYQSRIFVYDKNEDKVVSTLEWGSGEGFEPGKNDYFFDRPMWPRDRYGGKILGFDSVGMSPSGKYVVGGFPPAWVYSRDFSTTRVIGISGHADCAVDDLGREVVTGVGRYYGPDGYHDMGHWLFMKDLETGERFPLGPFGSSLNHVSGNSHERPGWAVVSSYAPPCQYDSETKTYICSEPDSWGDLNIIMYELTRRITDPDMSNHAKVWRVAHSHVKVQRYSDDPFAKLNLKGTKIFFTSGWNASINEGQADAYQIDLPEGWYDDLMGEVDTIKPAKPVGLAIQ